MLKKFNPIDGMEALRKRRLNTTQIIIFGFIAIIALGSLLLTLPVSSRSGEFTSLETASFTAVSATCITGLSIEDTMLHWSTFGQVVIITLIQIGGLGFMTLALLLSMLLKRQITPRERVIAAQSLGLSSFDGTVKLVKRVLIGTFSIELIGACVLATQLVPLFGWGDGIYRSVFHSISAFCNAGFDLMGDYSGASTSLSALRGNYVVNITICMLIILGGLGFIVWSDFVDWVKHRDPFMIYSKLVLIITSILIVGGTLLVFAFEYGNPDTIGNLPLGEKLLASLFHSVSTRTAGFFTIDNSLFTENTKVISLILMLIGGASGSTAGGLKVVTVGIAVYTLGSVAAGNTEIVVFKRRISQENIMRAFSIIGIALLLVFVCTLIITVIDGTTFLDTIYECVSAIATVGLSVGITASLSLPAHLMLMAMMFFGKVGILTVTFSIMLRITQSKSCITYPDTMILIG